MVIRENRISEANDKVLEKIKTYLENLNSHCILGLTKLIKVRIINFVVELFVNNKLDENVIRYKLV